MITTNQGEGSSINVKLRQKKQGSFSLELSAYKTLFINPFTECKLKNTYLDLTDIFLFP